MAWKAREMAKEWVVSVVGPILIRDGWFFPGYQARKSATQQCALSAAGEASY
jgi:hypothetical protein